MGSLSLWHWLIVILVVVLLFGRNKISDLMGDMAKGVKAFKEGLKDINDDKSQAQPQQPNPTAQVTPPVTPPDNKRDTAHVG